MLNIITKEFQKGGEEKMKRLSLMVLIGALVLFMPAIASALSLTVSAQVTSGTSLGSHTLLDCNGWNYNCGGDPFAQCTNKGTSGALTFHGKATTDPLTTTLYDTSGNPTVGADCFYAANFYIVSLYPDAWGGAGYELKQSVATLPSVLQNSVVFTPTYSLKDKFVWATGSAEQGDLTAEEKINNPQLVTPTPKLAKDGGLILKAYRARIVRAEYGIPPKPGAGGWCGATPPAGWSAIPLTATAGTYSAGVTITLTQI